jgi:hypothetical protein
MTVCFMQQELRQRLGVSEEQVPDLAHMLDDVQTLLGKVR